jgi:hypothetical protein
VTQGMKMKAAADAVAAAAAEAGKVVPTEAAPAVLATKS